MSTKRSTPAGRGKKKPKQGRGRPLKFTAHAKRLVLYVPPSLLDGLRRYAAREEMEGRRRPTATDVVLLAIEAYRPLHDFLVEKGLANYRAVK